MSKLLKRSNEGRNNSYHISQIKASIDSLIATHTSDDDAHHTPGVSAAQYLIDEHVGSSNKGVQTCIFEGEAAAGQSDWEIGANYRNFIAGGSDTLTFGITLPIEKIVNGTTYYLRTDAIIFALEDADANDFITQTLLFTYNGTAQTLDVNDVTNYTTIAEHTVTYGPIDHTLDERLIVQLVCTTTTSRELEIAYIRIRYYYDT